MTLPLPDDFVTLDSADLQVRLQAKEGWAAAQGHDVVVVLATELTADLVREGLARDFVRALQEMRKELGFQFTDRINVTYRTGSAKIPDAVNQFVDYIKSETLSVQLGFERDNVRIKSGAGEGDAKTRLADVAGETVTFWVQSASPQGA